VLITFGTGFYLAQLYVEISALIEERQAALTSAIYSAPAVIRADDDLARLNLLGRLTRLSYTETPRPTAPGEFSVGPHLMLIYARAFREGTTDYPAQLVRLSLSGDRIDGIADRFGVAMRQALLEPEVIGRLLPGTPAERVEVALGELKPFLVKGLLATEDRWFYYHPGFDPIRIIEAALADIRARGLVQGASTITQQLARTFLDRHERTFGRKFKELAVALVLEMRLSKRQILERYINDVPMGEYDGTPIEGLPLAARYLFNKDLREVTPAEAATLIGMIRAPTIYDPRRHPDAARRRRDEVLGVMWRARLIDRTAYTAAMAAPVTVAKMPGLRRAPYFTDYVTAFVRHIPGIEGLPRGLKVYTTLDPELEADAQASVQHNLARLEREHPRLRHSGAAHRLQSAMVALQADSGAILAMVGGRDYAQSQFNRATMAERQPGSAFKPIVYLTALDPTRSPLGRPLTLASTLPDRPMSFNGWTPANYEHNYRGRVTVAEALYESLNVPTAYLGSLLGPRAMVRTAHELGIHEHLAAVLPMAIGADETTLLELTSAYQVFADSGVKSPPYAVESVVDGQDHLIYSHHADSHQVIDPNVAYVITGALRAVLRYGTGASARRLGLDFPAAGKTGTTQDYKDAYFIGYTPEVVCGVWVGFDEPRSIGLVGAQAALPAWVSFMTAAAPNVGDDFPEPSGVRMVAIDPSSGGFATPACPRVIAFPFLLGTAPAEPCAPHGGLLASAPANAARPGAAASAPALQPKAAPTPASSSSMFGAIGRFFSSLFGH
jgi:penicillin-binding protein 1B